MDSKRVAQLREKIAKENLDALVVTSSDNQYYLTGFSATEYLDATVLVSADQAWISTDSRYYEDVKQRAPDFKLFEAGYDRSKVFGEFAAVTKPKVVGFEAPNLTVATLKEWAKAARKAGFKLKPVAGLVEQLRVVKDPDELAAIKRATELTDRAFAHFCECIKPGMTEKEGAWIIESYMREHGADKVAFDLIVGSGPNGALPHATPTDRKIERGEPIVVDIGARVHHYNSDLTRTVILGEATDQFKQVYQAALRSQLAAERKVKAGAKGKRVDAVARKTAAKSDFKEHAFQHGLGHGVGLAVHENPFASRSSKDTYAPNMTLTIEPGIYIPGWGGVRIEDLVVIHEDGAEILSQAPKNLEDMVIQ